MVEDFTLEQWEEFHNKFVLLVEKINKGKVEITGTFKGKNKIIEFCCAICRKGYKRQSKDLLIPFLCKSCSSLEEKKNFNKEKEKYFFDRSVQRFNKTVDENFEIISVHRKARFVMLLRCVRCGLTQWYTKKNIIKRVWPCPECRTIKQSKGAHTILKWLQKSKYTFKSEVRINGCKNKKALPFDFGLYKDKKLLYLIEFDGLQHFKSVDYFGGEEGLKYRKQNDKIKDEYCEREKIPLIRIDYKCKNIELILEQKLLSLTDVCL